jgi:hypothetical protein
MGRKHLFIVIAAFHLVSFTLAASDSLLNDSAENRFNDLPLLFIENQGQMHDEVFFYVKGSDRTLFFTSSGVTFVLFNDTERCVVKLDFSGADPCTKPVGIDRRETFFSYFKGPPDEWKTGIPSYGGIIYPNCWPGIDLAFTCSDRQLKYEFTVHPGADPDLIQLSYQGIEGSLLERDGSLSITTPLGVMIDPRPVAYQSLEGRETEVSVSYALLEKNNGLTYGFKAAAYDPDKPLVIDPVFFVFSGFIGGSDSEYCIDIALDGEGNIYVAGWTQSDQSTFPAKSGPDDTFNGGNDDGYVAKFDPSGTELIYCGYIGGWGSEGINDLAVDKEGNVYVTGNTFSKENSFPIRFGPDLSYNGSHSIYYMYGDAFIAKVNASGLYLDYCGYIGGSRDETGYGVAVDDAGCAYVTGLTDSSEYSFPVTKGPDLTYNGSSDLDAFVAKINPDGLSLEYCGYVGGDESERGRDIAVDGTGRAYIVGDTRSDEGTFPVDIGPDITYNDIGYLDAFVARVNADGTDLDFCGYIGGVSTDEAYCVAIDQDGFAYVGGVTYSNGITFPVLVGPDLTFNGLSDGFVACVDPSGSGLVFCGYLGGTKSEGIQSIAVDSGKNITVSGITQSDESSFPVLHGPDLTFGGGPYDCDCFVARIHHSGAKLIYCGYVGGDQDEICGGVCVDCWGHAYVSGGTMSDETTFPVIHGPDTTHNGEYDGFIAKISMALAQDAYTVTEGGGTVRFALTAGQDNAGRQYLMLGSLSGVDPGHPLPGGQVILPLNWDVFTDLVLMLLNTPLFSGFMGSLDGSGQSVAEMNTPALPPGYTGTVVYFAYCLNNPFDFASQPVSIEIVP